MKYHSLGATLVAIASTFVTVNARNWLGRRGQESGTATCSPLGATCSEDCDCCGYNSGNVVSSIGCRVEEISLGMRCYECALEGSSCFVDSDCCVGTCSDDRKCVKPCVKSEISRSSVTSVIGDVYNDVGSCPCNLTSDEITNDPMNAIDGSKDTDYVNNNAIGSGLVLDVVDGAHVSGLGVCTNTDCVECDPTCYKIEGIFEGATDYSFVQAGALDLSMKRGECSVVKLIGLPLYMKYKVTFPCIRGGFASCGAETSTELVALPCSEKDKNLRNVMHFEHSSYQNGVTSFIYGYFMPFYHMVLPYIGDCKFKHYQIKRGEGINTLMKTENVEILQDSRDPNLCMRGVKVNNFYPNGTMVADQKSRFYFLLKMEGAVTNTTSLHGIYGGNGMRGYHNIGVPDCSAPVETPLTQVCNYGKKEFADQAIFFATRKYANGYTYIGYEFNIAFASATIGMLGNCITRNNNYHVMKRTGYQSGEIIKTKPMKRFTDTRDPNTCMAGAKVSTYWNGQNLIPADDNGWYSFRLDLEGDVPTTQGVVGVTGGKQLSYYPLPVPDCSNMNYPAYQEQCSSSSYNGNLFTAGFGYNPSNGYTYFAYEFSSPFEKLVMEMFGECEFKNDGYELYRKTGTQAKVGTQVKAAEMEILTYERDPDLCMSGYRMTSLDDQGNLIPDGNQMYWFKFAIKGDVPRKPGIITIGGSGQRKTINNLQVPDCSAPTPQAVPSTCENYPMKVSEVDLIGQCGVDEFSSIVPTNVYALKSSTNGFYLDGGEPVPLTGDLNTGAKMTHGDAMNNAPINWQLFNVGKDAGGDKFAIKNVKTGLFLDGRDGQTGDSIYLDDRDPVNDTNVYGNFTGSDYLHWYLVDVGNGNIAFKSFTSGNYLDGRDEESLSGSAAYLTASNDPSSNPDLVWTLELTREWQDMEWFTSASLRPWQRFALQSTSSQSYLYGPVCIDGDINDLYTGIGPPETDPAYQLQVAPNNGGFSFTTGFDQLASGCHLDGRDPWSSGAVLGFSGKPMVPDSLGVHFTWFPADLGNNRFSLTNQASGHLLNGRNIADTGLNGAWLDASGSNPSSDSHLQWHIVYLYG